MNYEYLWKVLEQLLIELRGKGVTVPAELVEDLKSAQTYINIYKTDATALDIVTEIELYLEKVESNLMYLAESDVGEAYATQCLQRISDARMQGLRETAPVKSKFVVGVPKGRHWIRFAPSDLIGDQTLDTLIAEFHLSSEPQENGYLLIHGQQADIKAFLKAISAHIADQKRASSP